jgi:hypothetical protein
MSSANPDVAQRPEERIAVTGNDDVSRVARQGRVLEMSGATLQGPRIRAMENDGRQLHAWYGQRGYRSADVGLRMPRRLGGRQRPRRLLDRLHRTRELVNRHRDLERALRVPLGEHAIDHDHRAPDQRRGAGEQEHAFQPSERR